MVKGINKRVIVVKAPDPRLFEQAIFIMREDAFAEGVSAEQVLEEAQKAAKSYVRGNTRVGRWIRFLPAPPGGSRRAGGHGGLESGSVFLRRSRCIGVTQGGGGIPKRGPPPPCTP